MPRVTIKPQGETVEVRTGASLLQAVDELTGKTGLNLFHGELCEGKLQCGNCAVRVEQGGENLSRPTRREQEILADLDFRGPDFRLSCQARVAGDVTIAGLDY